MGISLIYSGSLNSLLHPGRMRYQRSACLAWPGTFNNSFTWTLTSASHSHIHPGPSFLPILIQGANQWTSLSSEKEDLPGPETLSMVLNLIPSRHKAWGIRLNISVCLSICPSICLPPPHISKMHPCTQAHAHTHRQNER